MSVVTQLVTTDPNLPWIVGSVPLAIGLDLALGDLPGRTFAVQGMQWLIAVVEDGVGRVVTRVGGGRGADLFGGLVLTALVVGTTISLTWVAVDLGDQIGGPVALGVRSILIAAGLIVRATGDRILHAAEASDLPTAGRWLVHVGGSPPTRLLEIGIDETCIATVGEKTTSLITAPLFWLAVGGPAFLWGWLAFRSLRESRLAARDPASLLTRVPVTLADLAEWIPACGTWIAMTVAAAILRRHPVRAWRMGWRAFSRHPLTISCWNQAALAGALGVQIRAGRVFDPASGQANLLVGDPVHQPSPMMVVLAVRMMQIVTILAAGGAVWVLFLLI